eukprot:TRINITY_DN4608_c0_g1_i1.p1 TRINITY_DN4608_c0_g1~~TRINITY_DN4608_c0_g1_i1.p1  ORF type:complete len:688 (-),score=148.57 TRINITY_DN4608_c0_g1_i1:177-2240(-)
MLPARSLAIDIHRHRLKGIYVLNSNSQAGSGTVDRICTFRQGLAEDLKKDTSVQPDSWKNSGAITFSVQGDHIVLRPWDPDKCFLAAAIHNHVIGFPIRQGKRVLALGCSLITLSHVSDLLSSTAKLIAVMIKDAPDCPSEAQIDRFHRRHSNTVVVAADVQSATLEDYERLLSIPVSSQYAFLMALHSRLGAESPARVLAGENASKLCKHIFSFLKSEDLALTNSLIVNCWPKDTKAEDTRELVLRHTEIVSKWKNSQAKPTVAPTTDGDDGEKVKEKKEKDGSDSDKDSEAKEDKENAKWQADKRLLRHILINLPLNHMISDTQTEDRSEKVTEVAEAMKYLENGERTGMTVKERLMLKPYAPDNALLLLKCQSNREGRPRSKKDKVKDEAAPGQTGGAAPSEVAVVAPNIYQQFDSSATGALVGLGVKDLQGKRPPGPPPGPPPEPPALPPGMAPGSAIAKQPPGHVPGAIYATASPPPGGGMAPGSAIAKQPPVSAGVLAVGQQDQSKAVPSKAKAKSLAKEKAPPQGQPPAITQKASPPPPPPKQQPSQLQQQQLQQQTQQTQQTQLQANATSWQQYDSIDPQASWAEPVLGPEEPVQSYELIEDGVKKLVPYFTQSQSAYWNAQQGGDQSASWDYYAGHPGITDPAIFAGLGSGPAWGVPVFTLSGVGQPNKRGQNFVLMV